MSCAAGSGDALPPQFGIVLGHLDVRMAENLRKLVKIAAIHHVPGRKRLAEIVKTKIPNPRPFLQVFRTSFHAQQMEEAQTLAGSTRQFWVAALDPD